MKKVAQTVIAADQFYTLANAAGKVIEAAEGQANGGAIQLGVYDHKASQEWAFIRVGEGVYRIKNRGTGKMMDLMMGGSADGTWLHQWEDANSSSQMWIVENTSDGRVKIKAQLAPAKCVDVVNMSTESGARLQIWQDVNGENQLWKISEVAEKKTRAAKAAPAAEKAEAKAEVKVEAPKTETKKAAPKAEEKPAAAVKAAPKAETKKAAAPKAEAKKPAPAAVKAEAPKAETKKPAAKKAAAKKPAAKKTTKA